MRMGTAARRWEKLAPSSEDYRDFHDALTDASVALGKGGMELCFSPFSISDALSDSMEEPPATLLVLPNGWVKVAAALPYICADSR